MNALAAHLRKLECELHRPSSLPESRRQALLHADFREFGRSGTRYDRPAILALLSASSSSDPRIHAQDFELQEPAPGLALLSYRSAHIQPDGSLARHSNRMSVWKHGAAEWQMMFHQGTPTEPFDRKD